MQDHARARNSPEQRKLDMSRRRAKQRRRALNAQVRKAAELAGPVTVRKMTPQEYEEAFGRPSQAE